MEMATEKPSILCTVHGYTCDVCKKDKASTLGDIKIDFPVTALHLAPSLTLDQISLNHPKYKYHFKRTD